jgi:hypothetical protein
MPTNVSEEYAATTFQVGKQAEYTKMYRCREMKRQDRCPEQTIKVRTGNKCALERVTTTDSITPYKLNV